MVQAPTGAKCRSFLGPGRHAYLPIARKKVNGREIFQTVKGVLYIRNGIGIFAGDGVDAPIVNTKPVRAIWLFGQANRRGPGRIRRFDDAGCLHFSDEVVLCRS